MNYMQSYKKVALAHKPDSVLCDHLSDALYPQPGGTAHNGCLLEIAHRRVYLALFFTK